MAMKMHVFKLKLVYEGRLKYMNCLIKHTHSPNLVAQFNFFKLRIRFWHNFRSKYG